MFNSNASPILTNVLFSENIALNSGGGMINSASSSSTLTNVTFFANDASSGSGGGMLNDSSSPSLYNSVFMVIQLLHQTLLSVEILTRHLAIMPRMWMKVV